MDFECPRGDGPTCRVMSGDAREVLADVPLLKRMLLQSQRGLLRGRTRHGGRRPLHGAYLRRYWIVRAKLTWCARGGHAY